MRYHIDTSAQSLALATLADLAEGTISLHDAMLRLDGAVSFASHLPYGNAAALALAVLGEFVAHLDSANANPVEAIKRMQERLDSIIHQPIATESTDPGAVSFVDALDNQGFWAEE